MPAGDELVEDDSEGEHVGFGRHRLSSCLLRRHVADRAEDQARFRCRASGVGRAGPVPIGLRPRQPEIEQLDVAVGPYHDIVGLDVAMDDLRAVGDGKRLSHLPGDADNPRQG